jgi:hypothetical protein
MFWKRWLAVSLLGSAAWALPPREPGGGNNRADDFRHGSSGAADAINNQLRPQGETDFQRRRSVSPNVSQLLGTVVGVKRKVLYLQGPQGAIVPIDAQDLTFLQTPRAGQEVRATFQVADQVVNRATLLEVVKPDQ